MRRADYSCALARCSRLRSACGGSAPSRWRCAPTASRCRASVEPASAARRREPRCGSSCATPTAAPSPARDVRRQGAHARDGRDARDGRHRPGRRGSATAATAPTSISAWAAPGTSRCTRSAADGPMARAEGSLTVGTPACGSRARGRAPPRTRPCRRAAVRRRRGAAPAPAPRTPRTPREFQIAPERLQRVGVRSAPARSGRVLESALRAVGRVVADETTLADVVAQGARLGRRASRVDAVGDPVQRGRGALHRSTAPSSTPPRRSTSRRCAARRARAQTAAPDRADYLVRAARNRLRLWDIAPARPRRARARGAPLEQLPIRSPASGYVVEKNVVEGGAVEPGERLYRIAPLDRVWIEAEVYESELPSCARSAAGDGRRSPYLPGAQLRGRRSPSSIRPRRRDAHRARCASSCRTRTSRCGPTCTPTCELARRARRAPGGPAVGGAATPASAASSSVDLGEGRFRPAARSRSACAAARRSRSSPASSRGRRDRHLGQLPHRRGEPAARGAGAVVMDAPRHERRRRGPIARLIATCARNRVLTLLAVLAAARLGRLRRSATRPLDAIPDLSDVQVIVFTEWPGRSPDLVEDQITYPISTRCSPRREVRFVRGQSFFGMSFVYVDLRGRHRHLLGAQPRARVPERRRGRSCPTGVTPTLGPDATGVGWVFEYALVDRSGAARPRRAAQPPGLEPALRARERARASPRWPRSAASCSQYQVAGRSRTSCWRLRHPDRRRDRAPCATSNEDVGGRSARDRRPRVRDPRPRLRAQRSRTCAAIAAARRATRGAPVCVEDVAEVQLGPDMRRGLAELDGEGEVGRRHRRDALRRERAARDRRA